MLGDFDNMNIPSIHLGFDIASPVVAEHESGLHPLVVQHNGYWKICRYLRSCRNEMRGRLRMEDGEGGACRDSWKLTQSGKFNLNMRIYWNRCSRRALEQLTDSGMMKKMII